MVYFTISVHGSSLDISLSEGVVQRVDVALEGRAKSRRRKVLQQPDEYMSFVDDVTPDRLQSLALIDREDVSDRMIAELLTKIAESLYPVEQRYPLLSRRIRDVEDNYPSVPEYPENEGT